MPDDEENIAIIGIPALVIGIAATGMQQFAIYLIRHIRAGGALDDDAFAKIAAKSVRDLKNSEMEGASIEEEAQTIGQGIKVLEKLIEFAVRRGKLDQS